MLSVAISPKDITTRELTNRKQMGAYTVPTKGQRTASRKISKQNIYKLEPTLYPLGQRTASRLSLYQLRAKGESPSDNIRILNKLDK
jgi:hypothetical protein